MGRTASTVKATPTPGSRKSAAQEAQQQEKESHRDTVEAIVFAFIVALVARGFEVQAFVIPTGSMAPTLMGRHKEVTCPQCGFVYTVNASEEIEGRSFPRQVYSGICVNCRFQAKPLIDAPSFKGDRILVMMFPYDLPFLPGASPPQRWDVVVFRYPEEPEVNYIKRLVGLPGETIRIKHGDIFVKPKGGNSFRLERKPLEHQSAMQMAVYGDRYQPEALAKRPEWRRWNAAGGWKRDERKPGVYRADSPKDGEWVDLRYSHLVPDPEQWDAILNNQELPRAPRPTLITDFYSYNTNLTSEGSNIIEEPYRESAWLQPHWVGDLTLSASVQVTSKSGELSFDLIKGGVSHRCIINLETGAAQLLRGEQMLLELKSPVKGPGRYQIDFANVDDRMTLWVNGRPVGGPGVEYDRGDEVPVPTAADLSPAGIAIRGGSAVVSDLVLKRDIYYTQYPGPNDYAGFELRLMPSLNDVSDIPTEGKDVIIVAAVNNVLHFRIFDGDGKVVVDTDETKLTEQARQIEDLRKQLESLWPLHELTWSHKGRLTTAVASIVGHANYAPVFGEHYPRNPIELFDFLADPGGFPNIAQVRSKDYELGEDRFLMLGDNSPRSKDSRGWDSSDLAWDTTNRKPWEVPRNLLTGKAFYIYWPHGVPFGPDIRWGRDTRLLFRPYFERMKWIR